MRLTPACAAAVKTLKSRSIFGPTTCAPRNGWVGIRRQMDDGVDPFKVAHPGWIPVTQVGLNDRLVVVCILVEQA